MPVARIVDLDMVTVPGGSFLMGCENGQENERPVHRVWIDSFALGRFPVANRDYEWFLAGTRRPAPPFWGDEKFSHPAKPVVGVTWDDAVAYCDWLSDMIGRKVRLPTEAEWERAARGGREGELYPWGDLAPEATGFVGRAPSGDGPATVGINAPNGFGLYDMSEGVHEWCADFYDYHYYRRSPERNPQGPPSGGRRASRGGSWRHRVPFSRSAARSSLPPNFQYSDYGFRVAVTIR